MSTPEPPVSVAASVAWTPLVYHGAHGPPLHAIVVAGGVTSAVSWHDVVPESAERWGV